MCALAVGIDLAAAAVAAEPAALVVGLAGLAVFVDAADERRAGPAVQPSLCLARHQL